MGMSKLDEIVALFQNESKEKPVFKMGLRQRKSRNWTIDTIQETVAVNKLSSPL
jgi:uroporphyrin-III C-methyltransferase